MTELSIVIPCLNEEESLGYCIDKAAEFLSRSNTSGEIVIGDNGSTDRSIEIAQEKGARVVNVPDRGYGAAIIGASKEAKGRFLIMGDADGSYDFLNLEGMLASLRKGSDLVMGNRFKGGIAKGAMPWKNKYIGNPVLSKIGQVFFKIPIGDFHCGLRGFSKDAFDRLNLTSPGMEFASEMVIKASLMKLNVTEVPTTLSPDLRSRPPHLRPWRDGWRHLKLLFMMSPRWLFLFPGILVTLIGLLATAAVATDTRLIGGVAFDLNTLVYSSACVILGVQLLSFAVLTRVYGSTRGFLPESDKLRFFLGDNVVEIGAVFGAVLFAAGVAGGISGVLAWSSAGFGQLDPAVSLRTTVPSALAMAIGCHLVFSSFFLGILKMDQK